MAPPRRVRRKGTARLWLKRNWLLVALSGLALAGVVLAILLLFEPCKKRVKESTKVYNVTFNVTTSRTYVDTFNATVNTTSMENVTSILNVTRNVTTLVNTTQLLNVTANVTSLYNETYRYNVTRNVTYFENVTSLQNLTVYENVTYSRNVSSSYNVTVNVTRTWDVDAISMLDNSGSMFTSAERRAYNRGELNHSANYAAGLEAMRTMFGELERGLRNESRLRVATGKWGTGHDVVNPLAELDGGAIARLTMTQEMEWTFYAHALVGCLDELTRAAEKETNGTTFAVCQIVTDGALMDDSVVYDGAPGPTQIRTNWQAADAAAFTVSESWDDGAVYDSCLRHGIVTEARNCSVWTIADHLKRHRGVYVQNVLVGNFASSPIAVEEMRALSSCDDPASNATCAWTVEVANFEALVASARDIAGNLASSVTSVRQTQTQTRRVESVELERREEATSITERVTQRAQIRASVLDSRVATRTESLTRAVTRAVLATVTSARTSLEQVTDLVTTFVTNVEQVQSLVRRNVTLTNVSRVDELQSQVSQRRVCTGDGFSFIWLLLLLPLLAYLFCKPIANVLERCCWPRRKKHAEPFDDLQQDDDEVIFSANPAYGMDLAANDPAPRPKPDRLKSRSAISAGLYKPQRSKVKKKVIGASSAQDEERGLNDLEDRQDPTSLEDVDLAEPLSPLHKHRRRSSAARRSSFAGRLSATRNSIAGRATLFARDDQSTDWAHGLAKVYDGDDWQERIFDAVYDAFTCNRCRSAQHHDDQEATKAVDDDLDFN